MAGAGPGAGGETYMAGPGVPAGGGMNMAGPGAAGDTPVECM